MNKSKGSYAEQIKYASKTFHVNFSNPALQTPAKYKSYAPASMLSDVFSSLFIGKSSSLQITKHHEEISKRCDVTSSRSRSTIGSILDEKRTFDFLSSQLSHTHKVAASLRTLCLGMYKGLRTALIDGIDLGEVHEKGGRCDLCLERKNGEKTTYFHRMVVLTMVSQHGPLPCYFRFCHPLEVVKNDTFSEEKFKSECELSCAKELLIEVSSLFKGRLPFDILGADALMANAPFMELTEALGAACVFIFKQENRKLYQSAKDDFCGKTFGFEVEKQIWDKDPLKKGRTFSSQWGRYVDCNRKGKEKYVKIFETIRTEKNGEIVSGMAITSDRSFITPMLVEAVRVGKWHDLENGVFNELTNQWGTLKHIFFHKTNAMQSMIALQFLCYIISIFYRFGNLSRGFSRFQGTTKDFFEHMTRTFFILRKKKLLLLRSHSPP